MFIIYKKFLSFDEKGWNDQNHSSGSHYPITPVFILWSQSQLIYWFRFSFNQPNRKRWFTRLVDVQGLKPFAICEAFWHLWMNFCIFSKNWESLKSDTSWIFKVTHWTSYIVSYLKPVECPLLSNIIAILNK